MGQKFHGINISPMTAGGEKGKIFLRAKISSYTVVHIHAQVKSDSSHGDVSAVIKKLKTHLIDTFPQDFPFYLLLTYRLHVMYSSYDCEELRTFIPSCISKFEGMDLKNIARVMISFIERCVHVHVFGFQLQYIIHVHITVFP